MKPDRLLALLLCSLMLFSLFACTNEETGTAQIFDENNESDKPNEGDTLKSKEATDTTTEKSKNAEETKENKEIIPEGAILDIKPTSDVKFSEFNKSGIIKQILLIDESGIKITAKELDYEEDSAELEFSLVNNTDKKLIFTCGNYVSVNGQTAVCNGMKCEVDAHDSDDAEVVFKYKPNMIYGVNEFYDFDLYFKVTDENDKLIYSGPAQLETSLAAAKNDTTNLFRKCIVSDAAMNSYKYEVKYFAERNCFENNLIRIESETVLELGGTTAVLYEMVNKSKEYLKIDAQNIKVNGLTIQSLGNGAFFIAPENKCIFQIALYQLTEGCKKAFEIDEIETVSATLYFYDDASKHIANPETVTVKLPTSSGFFSTQGTQLYSGIGIRILSKGIVEESSGEDSDICVYLLAENDNDKEYYFSLTNNSVGVNGKDIPCALNELLYESSSRMLAIKLKRSELEKISVNNPKDIEAVELSVKIKDKENKTLVDELLTVEN